MWDKMLGDYPVEENKIDKKTQTIRTAILLLVLHYTKSKTGNTEIIKRLQKGAKHRMDYDPTQFRTRDELATAVKADYAQELPIIDTSKTDNTIDPKMYYPDIIENLIEYLDELTPLE